MKSLDHRRDVRTIEQFEKDIALGALKEKIWAKVLKEELSSVDKECKIEEFGVDNSGKLILDKLPNNNVDKLFLFNLKGKSKKIPLEIKTIPEHINDFMTFKASSLLACKKNKACILVPKRFEYYVYSKKACIYLYENYSHKIYWNFQMNKGFSPNDPAVRIYKKEITRLIDLKLVKLRSWKKESKKIIEENWSILSRKN